MMEDLYAWGVVYTGPEYGKDKLMLSYIDKRYGCGNGVLTVFLTRDVARNLVAEQKKRGKVAKVVKVKISEVAR